MSTIVNRILLSMKRWLEKFSFLPVDLRSYEDLKHIHQRRFALADKDRFARLWCEIAARCSASATGMSEDSRVDELLSRKRHLIWPSLQLDELHDFILEESRSLEAPWPKMHTVADVLDYLLFTDAGDPITHDDPPLGDVRTRGAGPQPG